MTEGAVLRLPDYLGHIAEAIRRIKAYTSNLTKSGFLENQMVQDAVIRNLEIVGEASRNIDRHFPLYRSAHPEVSWISAYEMRNALAHGYFKVDMEIVWQTILSDLDPMARAIHVLLDSLDKHSPLE